LNATGAGLQQLVITNIIVVIYSSGGYYDPYDMQNISTAILWRFFSANLQSMHVPGERAQ
jgi:hypothetical protein